MIEYDSTRDIISIESYYELTIPYGITKIFPLRIDTLRPLR